MNPKQKTIKTSLGEFLEGMKDLSSNEQQIYRPFQEIINSINNPGKLEEKTKVLINVAIAVYCRNQVSLYYHIKEAYKLGATEEEITEASMVAIIPGGMNAMTFFVTEVQDAVEALREE